MKKLLGCLVLSLTVVSGFAAEAITILSVKLSGLPSTTGQFSVYCGGTHIGNCKTGWMSSSIKIENLLIGIEKSNNTVVIHRADEPWDEFSIPLEKIPQDVKNHTFTDTRSFDNGRKYKISITYRSEALSVAKIKSFHVPNQMITSVYGEHTTLLDPVVYMDICSNGNILHRSEGKSFKGEVHDFDFNYDLFYFKSQLPLTVKFYVAPQKEWERGTRAAVGSSSAALVGGLIGGTITGCLTGGFGAPAGAAIGATIGAAIGGVTGAVLPITNASEIARFDIKTTDDFKKQTKKYSGSDLALDGAETVLDMEGAAH